jgi:PmbA protein
VERARAAGADQADAVVDSARSFTVSVLGGRIETLKQSVTHGLGLRVIVGGAVGFVSTNDFRSAAIDDLARRAVDLARFSTPDVANGLPAVAETVDPAGEIDLRLHDPAVEALTPEVKIDMALALERIALAYDPRIRRTDGASVSSRSAVSVLVNSHGIRRVDRGTSVRMGVAPLADDRDGKQQSGYYGIAKRWVRDLPSVEAVALEAARRAVARIGARSVPAERVPVVLHPDIGASWLAEMHEAFSGEEVLKQSSWLSSRLGETIAAPHVTLVDDGRLDAGLGSEVSDGEGVPTRRNVLIDRGVCAMFEYDTYHARRAGTRSTGSAVRSYSSLPGIGYHNLLLEPGTETPEAILARVDRGFFMDDQGSFGFNPVTGDYSYQAQGFWIEKGVKTFPVEGVTIASNSLDMLKNIVAIGNDLVFEHSVACPTLLIAEMTLSGNG